MDLAKKNNITGALLDRLFLDESRINNSIRVNIIRLDDPIGAEIKNWTPKMELI